MKPYQIGYTTGVFDLFHIGHLNLLRRAKEQCETLIVGVSTDEVVQSYKQHAPIIPFEERIAIVSAIRYVDRVVPQTSMNKAEAWQTLRFQALFHGTDWQGSALYQAYERELEALGVQVVYLPHTKGVSTSGLLDRLNGEVP